MRRQLSDDDLALDALKLLTALLRNCPLYAPSGPQLQQTAGGPILAPIDLRAGGTWLGLNADGVFAAVTNRRSVFVDSDRRSRGDLVLDALAGHSAREGARRIEEAPEALTGNRVEL